MNFVRRGALLVGALGIGALCMLGSASASTNIPAAHSDSAGSVAAMITSDPVSVDTWYPWGTYATQAQCVDAGNRYLREEPWNFRAYMCQKQSIVWKLYLDEING